MKQASVYLFFVLLVFTAACTRCGAASNQDKGTSEATAALQPEKAAVEKEPEVERRPAETAAQPPAEPPAPPPAELSDLQAGKGNPMPSGEMDLSLVLDVDFEHGCSQSMESRSISGTLDLKIFTGDKAVLALDIEEYYTFGPSLGKFKQGHRDFTHRYWKERRVWKGKAKRKDDLLIFKFKTVDTARKEFPLYSGGGSMPPATPSASTLELTCRYMQIDVYGPVAKNKSAFDVDKETPKRKHAILCKPNQEVFDWYQDHILMDEFLPFSAAPGFILSYNKLYWTDTKVLRQFK